MMDKTEKRMMALMRAALCYDRPNLRCSGDIDLYLGTAEVDRAIDVDGLRRLR